MPRWRQGRQHSTRTTKRAGQEGTVMVHFTRRSVLRGSLGFAAAGVLARPYIANAAGTTLNVWWTQGEEYTETALLTVRCYNNVEKKRSIYGVPYTVDVFTNHVWRSLVEKAGYKMADIPTNWDAFYDFFKGVQKALREQGMRHVYGLGFQVTTNGGDCNSFFNQFLISYGGQDIVTKDGKLHLDDPKVREAALHALTYPTTAYKEAFVPPGAINWNDADDNSAS